MLSLLLEHGDVLLAGPGKLEHTLLSLQAMYLRSTSAFLKSNLLVVLTGLMLRHDCVQTQVAPLRLPLPATHCSPTIPA